MDRNPFVQEVVWLYLLDKYKRNQGKVIDKKYIKKVLNEEKNFFEELGVRTRSLLDGSRLTTIIRGPFREKELIYHKESTSFFYPSLKSFYIFERLYGSHYDNPGDWKERGIPLGRDGRTPIRLLGNAFNNEIKRLGEEFETTLTGNECLDFFEDVYDKLTETESKISFGHINLEKDKMKVLLAKMLNFRGTINFFFNKICFLSQETRTSEKYFVISLEGGRDSAKNEFEKKVKKLPNVEEKDSYLVWTAKLGERGSSEIRFDLEKMEISIQVSGKNKKGNTQNLIDIFHSLNEEFTKNCNNA